MDHRPGKIGSVLTQGGDQGSRRALLGRHAAQVAPPIAGPSESLLSGEPPVATAPSAAPSERPLLAGNTVLKQHDMIAKHA